MGFGLRFATFLSLSLMGGEVLAFTEPLCTRVTRAVFLRVRADATTMYNLRQGDYRGLKSSARRTVLRGDTQTHDPLMGVTGLASGYTNVLRLYRNTLSGGRWSLDSLSDSENNLGHSVVISYLEKEGQGKFSSTLRIRSGYVLDQIQGERGVKLIMVDEQDGSVFSIDPAETPILSLEMKTNDIKWQKASTREQLDQILDLQRTGYAVVYQTGENGQRTYSYGELTRSDGVGGSGYQFYVARGTPIDPDYSNFRFFITRYPIAAFKKMLTTVPGSYDETFSVRRLAASNLEDNPSPFANPYLYVSLDVNRAHAEKLFLKWYGAFNYVLYSSMLRRLSSTENYLPLLSDFGIASHFRVFHAFAEEYLKQHEGISAWELREAFREFLGEKKVFVGVYLTDDEAKDVLDGKARVQPEAFASYDSKFRAIVNHLDPQWRANEEHISLRTKIFQGLEYPLNTYDTPFLLWGSDDPENAAAFAAKKTSPLRKQGRHLYIARATLPALSLIEPTGMFERDDVAVYKDAYEESGDNYIYSAKQKHGTTYTAFLGVNVYGIAMEISPQQIISLKKSDECGVEEAQAVGGRLKAKGKAFAIPDVIERIFVPSN